MVNCLRLKMAQNEKNYEIEVRFIDEKDQS